MTIERVFVDTNVLVYAHDLDAEVKRAIAEHVLRQRPDAPVELAHHP